MMSDKREVKVGDAVNTWDLLLPEYAGCEFKVFERIPRVEITKVPDPKPEIPDEPMTRGSVVTIEGDDEFIAVRFMDDGYITRPYIYWDSSTWAIGDTTFSWNGILARAAGRKIIVHKMVDPKRVPGAVGTYEEWLSLPMDELKKYKWRDVEGDIWLYDPFLDTFLPEGEDYGLGFNIKEFLPLTRHDKIG